MRRVTHVMWKTGIVVGMRIETGVIPERALAPPLARLDVSFEDDLRARRHLEIDGNAFDEIDALAAQEAGQQQLVETLRHGRGGGKRQGRVGAERDRDRQPLLQPFGNAVMLRAALVPLPVHAGRAAVEHLHAIGADVAHAGFRVPGKDHRQGDVRDRRLRASR